LNKTKNINYETSAADRNLVRRGSLWDEEMSDAYDKKNRTERVYIKAWEKGGQARVPISALPGRGSEPQTDFRKRPKTLLIQDKSGKQMLIHRGQQSLVGEDTILRKRVESLFQGKRLDLPFLTTKENLVLTMRALGARRKQIAKTLSGGRRGWSMTTSAVKGILGRAYKKCRDNGMEVRVNERFLQFQIRR
jgi:hypothetical protein